MSEDIVGVEQVDREAAAAFYGPHLARPGEVPVTAHMRAGKIDESALVQAFARHRIAVTLTPEPSAAVDLEGVARDSVIDAARNARDVLRSINDRGGLGIGGEEHGNGADVFDAWEQLDAAIRNPPMNTDEQVAAHTNRGEVERLREAIREEVVNTPETADFMAAVPLEAAHQRERWGSAHDEGKSPFDWFWLIGYLAQKAADAAIRGDTEKAKHHTISTGAALANWHASFDGLTNMRPGISSPDTVKDVSDA